MWSLTNVKLYCEIITNFFTATMFVLNVIFFNLCNFVLNLFAFQLHWMNDGDVGLQQAEDYIYICDCVFM